MIQKDLTETKFFFAKFALRFRHFKAMTLPILTTGLSLSTTVFKTDSDMNWKCSGLGKIAFYAINFMKFFYSNFNNS